MGEWVGLVKRAVGLILMTVAVAGVVFVLFTSRQASKEGAEQIEIAANAAEMGSLQAYNQTRVPGTTIVNAIKNYRNMDMAVIVKTGDCVINYCAQLNGFVAGTPTGDGSGFATSAVLNTFNQYVELQDAIEPQSIGYINPAARFDVCLIYNDLGVVVGIYAEKKIPGETTNVR